MKKTLFICCVLTFAFVLFSCEPILNFINDMFGADEEIGADEDEVGSITYNLDLLLPKSIGYDIDQVHVTMTHQIAGTVEEANIAVDSPNDTATGTIYNLRTGMWDVVVELFESGAIIGTGSSTVEILPNQTVNATINISLDTGQVNITVTWDTASLFEDSFDAYVTGAPPVPPWDDYYWPASQPEITGAEAETYGVTVWINDAVFYGSSGKSLHFLDTSGTGSVGSEIYIVFNQATHVVFEYYMRSDNASQEGAFVFLKSAAGRDHALVFNTDGNIRLFANTGWLDSLLPYTVNTWYYVRRVLDVTTDTGSFYIEEIGNPANSGYYEIGMNISDTYIDGIGIQTSNSQGADCYIDEIQVIEIAP